MSILKKHFGNGTEKKDIRNAISLIAIIIIAVVLVLNSFYKVGEQEQAVITMFGQVQGIKSAGGLCNIRRNHNGSCSNGICN